MSNAKFYDRAVADGTAGYDGLPKYKMTTYFTRQIDANNTVDRAMRDEDKFAFPEEYDLYQTSRQPSAKGFPLAAWSGINGAERQGLADRGIYTVEQLAETDMTNAPEDFREAQAAAVDFLEKVKADGPKMAARLTALEAENEALKSQVEDLTKEVEILSKPAKTAKANG